MKFFRLRYWRVRCRRLIHNLAIPSDLDGWVLRDNHFCEQWEAAMQRRDVAEMDRIRHAMNENWNVYLEKVRHE